MKFMLSDGEETEENLEDEDVDVTGLDPDPATNEIICFFSLFYHFIHHFLIFLIFIIFNFLSFLKFRMPMYNTSRKSGNWRGAASARRPKKCCPTPPNAFLQLLSATLSWCQSRMWTEDVPNSQTSRRWFCRSFYSFFISIIFHIAYFIPFSMHLTADCTNWALNMARWSSMRETPREMSSPHALKNFCPSKMCRRKRSICARQPIPQQWGMGKEWSDVDARNHAKSDASSFKNNMKCQSKCHSHTSTCDNKIEWSE